MRRIRPSAVRRVGTVLAISILSLVFAVYTVRAEPAPTLGIAQLEQTQDRLTVYYELDAEQPAPALPTAELDGLRLTPLDAPAEPEGVAYLFLVDISQSIHPIRYKNIQAALAQWTLGPKDQAALVAFGDEVTTLCPFTGDASTLRAAMDQLGATDDWTALYGGLVSASKLLAQEGLPARKALIVITDGTPQSYVDKTTYAQVEEAVDACGAPVYPLLFEASGDAGVSIKNLQKLADRSGGVLLRSAGAAVKKKAEALRQRIAGSYAAAFQLPQTPGGPMELTLRLSDTLSATRALHLQPVAAPTPSAVPTPPPSPSPTASHSPAPTDTPRPSVSPMPAAQPQRASGRPSAYWLLALLALAAAVASSFALRRRWRHRRQLERNLNMLRMEQAGLRGPNAGGKLVLRIQEKTPRGSEQHLLALHTVLRIGSARKGNDIVLRDRRVAAQHLELLRINGQTYVRALRARDAVLLLRQGERLHVPVGQGLALRDGDTLAVGDTLLEISFVQPV